MNRLLGWTALALDILPDDTQRGTPGGTDVVGTRPEVVLPQVLLYLGRVFLAQYPRRHTFK